MVNLEVEQRMNLKFLIKFQNVQRKGLKGTTGYNAMSRGRVFEWHERFSKDRMESTCYFKNLSKVRRINDIVREDRHLRIRMIANMVNTDKRTVRLILHDEFNGSQKPHSRKKEQP